MRVIFHALTDDVCDFVKFAVVRFEERMEDSPLYRLQSVDEFGNRTVSDNVACILDKIAVEKIFYVCHTVSVYSKCGLLSCSAIRQVMPNFLFFYFFNVVKQI